MTREHGNEQVWQVAIGNANRSDVRQNAGTHMIELRRHTIRRGRRAFTLVELMVAIALVLVIIIGVNEVFRLTSNTINAGQTLSGAVRDQRAVRTTMEDDFSHMAADGPALIITNKAVAAYRSREDELASASLVNAGGVAIGNNPLRSDLNGDGISTAPGDANYVTGETASPATPGSRVRRIDTVTFFVRKPGMSRQTPNLSSGNPTEAVDLVGKALASESMVTYGHLRLPDNSSTQFKGTVSGTTYPGSTFFEPGEPDKGGLGITPPTGVAGKKNDNNRYYTQWVLGRGQLLMVPSAAMPTSETRFVGATAGSPMPLALSPLSMRTNTASTPLVSGDLVNVTRGTAYPYTESRTAVIGNRGPYASTCDVADTSLLSFSQQLAAYIRDVEVGGAGVYGTTQNNGLWYLPAAATSYSDSSGEAVTSPTETLSYRFNGNPFGTRGFMLNGTNLLAQTLSESAPVLVPRCTNFIVEFAGDFVTQYSTAVNTSGVPDPLYGLAYKPEADGDIDFVVIHGVRKIRWYGLPRYTGSGDIETSASYSGPSVRGLYSSSTSFTIDGVTYNSSSDAPTLPNHEQLPDVVPVSDMLCASLGATGTNARTFTGAIAPFEKVLMTDQTFPTTNTGYFYDLNATVGSGVTTAVPGSSLPPQANYANPGAGTALYNLQRANYVCAWQGTQPRPKMIRITMTLEDPNSRNDNGGQTYEYVFNVP